MSPVNMRGLENIHPKTTQDERTPRSIVSGGCGWVGGVGRQECNQPYLVATVIVQFLVTIYHSDMSLCLVHWPFFLFLFHFVLFSSFIFKC